VNRNIIRRIILLVCIAQAQPAWSGQVFRCIGESGETVFTARPCESPDHAEQQRKFKVSEQRLELLEMKIAESKYDLMELDMQFRKASEGIDDDARQVLTEEYKLNKKTIKETYNRLTETRSLLIEEMVSEIETETILVDNR